MDVDKVYRTQLLRRYPHLGLPLRNARPKQVGNGVREVFIGDVGWQSRRDSAFHILFNAIDPSRHPDLPPPEDYRPCPIAPSRDPEGWDLIHSHAEAALPVVPIQSRSITKVELSGSLSTIPTAGPPLASLKVSCSKDKGAVLIIHQPADHDHLEPCQEIQDYVLQNFQSWYSHASSRGLSLEMGELILVTETYKTSKWDTFAFTSRGYEAQFSLQGAAPTLTSAALSVSVSSSTLSDVHQLYGPVNTAPQPYTTVSGPDSAALPMRAPTHEITNGPSPSSLESGSGLLPRNQCIFLQGYLPYKRSLFPAYLKAAAEPIDLGGPPSDDSHDAVLSASPSSVRMLVDSPQVYDPLLNVVQRLLEEFPTADYAIAHHRILTSLLSNSPNHEELADSDDEAGLELRKPSVVVEVTTISGDFCEVVNIPPEPSHAWSQSLSSEIASLYSALVTSSSVPAVTPATSLPPTRFVARKILRTAVRKVLGRRNAPSVDVIDARYEDTSVARRQLTRLGFYLMEYLTHEATNARPTSRENLARLNHQGFLYMSADLYNELVRRQASGNAAPDTVQLLSVCENFAPKRKEACHKLATLPTACFQDLASDVYHELWHRYPEFIKDSQLEKMWRTASPAESLLPEYSALPRPIS